VTIESCAICALPIPAINDPRFPAATDEQTELELLADGRRSAHAVCAELNGAQLAVPRKQFDLFGGAA